MVNVLSSSALPVVRKVGAIWVVLLIVFVAASIMSDRFLATANVINILQQGVIVGIVALGMTLVLILGHFDLSTGAVVMMAAVFAIVLDPITPTATALAVILPLAAGMGIGAINGIVVCHYRANSIVATLGMQFFLIGAVLALVKGAHVRTDGETAFFWAISNGSFAGVPLPVFLFIAIAIILAVLMNSTVFGRHVYAIGGDPEAARRAGIANIRVGVSTFVISGGLAALAGILVASRVRNLDPTGVAGYEFPALTAAVLGGASLAGGKGRPLDTVAAILVISIITNLMTLKGYPHSSQLFAQGLILALAVAYYELQERRVGS